MARASLLPIAVVPARRWSAWIELDDVGHAPQLDVPLETAQLILELTSG